MMFWPDFLNSLYGERVLGGRRAAACWVSWDSRAFQIWGLDMFILGFWVRGAECKAARPQF